jgi:thymidylate synthase
LKVRAVPDHDLAAAYRHGLSLLLEKGEPVPSVLGAKSKASNFGRGDRPWIELRAHQFSVHLTRPQALTSAALPTNLTYLFGLLAWTLDGRDDVDTLAYYRRSAMDFSDDGMTLCGAFGARLFDRAGERGQISAVCERLAADPASRRTYASIIGPADNLAETLEYPCAAGIQMFLRDEKLHWLTVMRAQQALTILPYDAFLFSCLHQFIASSLGCEVGDYIHFSGTFHIYENERALAAQVLGSDTVTVELPAIPAGHGEAVARELIELEENIRTAAVAHDEDGLRDIGHREMRWEFNNRARRHLLDFARSRATVQAAR